MPAQDSAADALLSTMVDTIEQLSLARTAPDVASAVRSSARRLSGADGVTVVLREADQCHYVEEDAIGPLWKGQRFPLQDCISGWVMLNGQTAVIPDIYQDERIPHDAYRPTFVKSLVMTPVRPSDPIAAIGAYWSEVRTPSAAEIAKLGMIARATATALENVRLISTLEQSLERRDFLIREMDHRVKNNLAAVRAIAQQTLRSAESPAAFNEALMGRLMALSRGHELLARDAGAGAGLRDVLEQSTAPYAGSRLDIIGPEVRLSAQAAANFQMAFHELATNAVRHGALSAPEGRVEVIWSLAGPEPDEDAGRLEFTWREYDGPPVSDPQRRGFGLKLIERGLAQGLGGRSSLTFEPAGLCYQLTAPFSDALGAG